MNIPKNEISHKELIGKRGTNNVWLIRTIGGLNMICVDAPGKAEIAAVASHPAMAEFIAQQKDTDIKYTSLRKSLIVFDVNDPILIKYTNYTDIIRSLQKKQ